MIRFVLIGKILEFNDDAISSLVKYEAVNWSTSSESKAIDGSCTSVIVEGNIKDQNTSVKRRSSPDSRFNNQEPLPLFAFILILDV